MEGHEKSSGFSKFALVASTKKTGKPVLKTKEVDLQEDYEESIDSYSDKMDKRIKELDELKRDIQQDLKLYRNSKSGHRLLVDQTANLISVHKTILDAEKEKKTAAADKVKMVIGITKAEKEGDPKDGGAVVVDAAAVLAEYKKQRREIGK